MTRQTNGPSELPPSFTPQQRKQFARAYGFSDQLVVTPLHKGENHHYLCRGTDVDCFARISPRPIGQTWGAPLSLESEIAWIEALSTRISTATALKTREGAQVQKMTFGSEDRMAAVFETLYGYHLTHPTPSDWQTYGRVLRDFHDAARAVLEIQDPGWIGRTRQRFEPAKAVLETCEAISQAPWVDRDLAAAFEREAGHLAAALNQSDLASDAGSFLHFDLHLANILITPGAAGDTWVLLDFEECCFGPRAIDLGVVRLHARSEARLKDAWKPFADGYGDNAIVNEAPLGAALKAMHLAGKIPDRLDVPDVAKDPVGILRHLLDTIRQEIH